MSKKTMMTVMVGAVCVLASHSALARGGGGHGGMRAMAVVRPAGATSPTMVHGGQTGHPNINVVTLGNQVSTIPAIPANVGTSSSTVRGVTPGLAFSPSGTPTSRLDNPPPLGTNASGTALSSGPSANARSSEHLTTGQSGGNKAKSHRPDEDSAIDSENPKIDRIVKSICTGC